MKTFLRIAATGMTMLASSWAAQADKPTLLHAAGPAAPQADSWSLVYLPDLEWSDAEVKQTVALLQQPKPDLVVSMAPCPFAETIRNLECKPIVLDRTQRAKLGVACGVPAIPLSQYQDATTLQSFGNPAARPPCWVWLAAAPNKERFTGPGGDSEELRSLARIQVRKQFAERRNEVIFLIDPSVPTPSEERWGLPLANVHYEQATSAVTSLACLRPGSLQAEVSAIDGIAPRVPILHWIHSGAKGMEWEVLPTDGEPAIDHSALSYAAQSGSSLHTTIGWLHAPPAPSAVPLWMDDYINGNPALGCGNSRKQGATERRYGWIETGVTRDKYHRAPSGRTG